MNALPHNRIFRGLSIAAMTAIGAHAVAQCPGIRPAFTWASVGTTMTFTDVTVTYAMPPDSGRWYFGDGGQDTGLPTVTHTYTTTGANEVTLILWFSDCPFIASALVAHGDGNDDCTVAIAPSFTASQPANNLVQFTNTTSASDITLSQAWIFDDLSAPDFADSPSHFYLLPGSYAAALSVAGTDSSTMDGCVAGMVRTIAVDGNASTCDSSLFVDFTLTDLGGPIQVDAQVIPFTASLLPWDLSWDFGDQSVPLTTIASASHYYAYPGEYQICLHVYAADTLADDSCEVVVCRSLEQYAAAVDENPESEPLHVFPNPFTDRVSIRNTRLQGPVEVVVMDLAGATVTTQRFPDGQTGFDLGHLAPGAYVLQANAHGRSLRCPVIKY